MTRPDPRSVRLFLGYLLTCYAMVASFIATIAALLVTDLVHVQGVTPLEEFATLAGVLDIAFGVAHGVAGARICRALKDRAGGAR